MLVTKEQTKYHNYALSFDYDQSVVEYCQYLKNILGWTEFQFDPDLKKWRFKDPLVVNMLKNKFSYLQLENGIEKDIEKFLKQKEEEKEKEQNAIRIKEAKTSNLEIKGIKGELYEYQKLGIEFFINSGGRAILADSAGVGKSCQALGFVAHCGHQRTLVVCPASVKYSWQNEISKWTKLKSFIVEPKTKFSDISHDVNVVIINYDVLRKNFNELMKYKFDVCILDEAQYIKSPTSIRSKVTKQLSKNIPYVLLLTGTPILNRPIELFNLLNVVDPKKWNNWYQYAVRYADGKRTRFGFEANGATNLEELKQKIEKYFLRRTKEEVLSQLPPKNRINVPMELPKDISEQYKTAASSLAKYLKKYKNETDANIMKTVQAEKLVRINYLRQISSLGKVETAKELIQNIVDGEEKVIVFSCFNDPLLRLQEHFKEQSVMIIGSTNVSERGEIVKKFQEDPKIKIFLGGIKSAGTGITLTAASSIVNIDFSWTPADMDQSENRAHRPGAVYESLNIYQITSKGTIDDFMKKLLVEKQEIFDKLFDGKQGKKQGSILDEITEDIEKNY